MEILVSPNLIAPRMCDEGGCVCTTYCPYDGACDCDTDIDICIGDGDEDGGCTCKGVHVNICPFDIF